MKGTIHLDDASTNIDYVLDTIRFFEKSKEIMLNLKEIRNKELAIIQNKMSQLITTSYSLKEFLQIYNSSWALHNSFDKELTSSYQQLLELSSTPAGIEILNELLILSTQIDRAKRITSNVLKDILINYCNKNSLSLEEMQRILVPSQKTFYTEYYQNLISMDMDRFAKKYCRGSKRLAKYYYDLAEKNHGDIRFIKKNSSTAHTNIKKQQYELDFESIDELLYKDNYEEYLYKYQLIGITDYLLHEIAADITESKIYNFDEKIAKLSHKISKISSYFKYKIPKFKQTDYNCATACFLNGLYALKNKTPSRAIEREISASIKAFNDGTTATLPTLLAEIAKKKYELNATVFFEHQNLLSNDLQAVTGDYFQSFMKNLSSTIPTVTKAGVEVSIENVNYLSIRAKLVHGPVIIATWNGITHYNLIYGYDDLTKLFFIFDPITGGKTVNYKDFSSFIRTPFGVWGIHLSNDFAKLQKIVINFNHKLNALQKQCNALSNTTLNESPIRKDKPHEQGYNTVYG